MARTHVGIGSASRTPILRLRMLMLVTALAMATAACGHPIATGRKPVTRPVVGQAAVGLPHAPAGSHHQLMAISASFVSASIDWLLAAGSEVALPAVVDRKGPLEYRTWRPGETLVDGVWNIPIPEKREVVVPQAVLAPLVGFDRECYRLGYGGGYFDRTLAALTPRPWAIGVGFELSGLETIHPQDFDVPMDVIVTEVAVHQR